MLDIFFGIPLWLGYILCAASVLPIVTYGITLISRFQLWTQPVWLVLNVAALVAGGRGASGLARRMGRLRRHRAHGDGAVQPAVFRRLRLDAAGADQPDGGTGGLPAVPAAADPAEPHRLVGGAAGGRPRLDRLRRAEAAGRVVPGLWRDVARLHRRGGDAAGADVPHRLPGPRALADGGAGPDQHLRHAVAAEDQRHQRLCRVDRLVELLLPPDAQPSRPGRVAGVQHRHRPAADGAGGLRGRSSAAWCCIRMSPRPGSAR